jgi:scyllo-inositol 2-dehydrogenase (NADP+)
MVRVALIGLGKMGISHLAIAKSHPDIELVAICDTTGYILDVLTKYTGIKTYSNYRKLLDEETLDAVIVATPSRFHAEIVLAALEKNLHVFCEKPFCLDVAEGRALADLAAAKNLVNQVGYHFRFVGAFQEAKRLAGTGVLGKIHHIRAEAYGPVVLRSKNTTWRAQKTEGGGCLYDYASHAIDLVTFIIGKPTRVGGTALNRIFSADVEDEVYTDFTFADGVTGQLAANWSDESYRKMSTKLTIWGTNGRLTVDRQEVQIFVRDKSLSPDNLKEGWNIFYTTELSDNLYYYLRGEEYSAQIDHFIQCITDGRRETMSSFASALATDEVVAMMIDDANRSVDVDTPRSSTAQIRMSSQRKGFIERARAMLRPSNP